MLHIRIYSVGVWNDTLYNGLYHLDIALEFTPLEFETIIANNGELYNLKIRIYSVGVWNVVNFWLSAVCASIRIYSVGVWNPPLSDR